MQVKIQHCDPSFGSYTWGKMHRANNEMHHSKMSAGMIHRNRDIDWGPQKASLIKLRRRPAAMDVDDDSRRHGPADDRDGSRRHGPTDISCRLVPRLRQHSQHWSQRLGHIIRGMTRIVLTTAGFQTLKYAFGHVQLARSLSIWRDYNVTPQLMQTTLAACGWPMAKVFNCLNFHDPVRETQHLGSHVTNLRGLVRRPRERQELIGIMTRVAFKSTAVFMELVHLPNHHQF